MAKTTQRTVLVDAYNWTDPDARRGEGFRSARMGATIDVSAEEAQRGEELGALGSPADLAAASSASSAPPAKPDEELRAMNAADLITYLEGRPLDAERVVAIEGERGEGKQRSTVLAAAEAAMTVLGSRQAEVDAQTSGLPVTPVTRAGDVTPAMVAEAEQAAAAAAGDEAARARQALVDAAKG